MLTWRTRAQFGHRNYARVSGYAESLSAGPSTFCQRRAIRWDEG